RGARAVRRGPVDELPRAHAPERPRPGSPRRDLGPHGLPHGPDRAGSLDGRAPRGARHRNRFGGRAMTKRMIFMLLAMLAFVAVIAFVKYQQVQAAIAQSSSFRPPPTSVSTIVAEEVAWESTLRAIGSAVAVQGVTV